jgi:hypothetical protein
MRKVFVAFPFSSEYDYVEAAVNRACQGIATVECARSRITNQHILDKIVGQMRDADLLLFDLTGRSKNVVLELGIAMGEKLNWRIVYDPGRAADGKDTISDLLGRDSGRYDNPRSLEQTVRAIVADSRNFESTTKHRRNPEDRPFLEFKLHTEKSPGERYTLVAQIRNLAPRTVATDVRPYIGGVGHLQTIPALAGGDPPLILREHLNDKLAFVDYLKYASQIIVEFADRHGNYYRQVGPMTQTFLENSGYSVLSAEGVGRPEEADENRLLPPTVHLAKHVLHIV